MFKFNPDNFSYEEDEDEPTDAFYSNLDMPPPPPPPPRSGLSTHPLQYNLILDMDGTLLDNIPPHFKENPNPGTSTPLARPHLRVFLEFAFANFERVSIWTAAQKSWYKRCYENVLKPCMPAGKSFDFVKTRGPYEQYIMLKPLAAIYDKYPAYNKSNTIIVDDNPYTYVDNMDNAVAIKPFFYDQLTETERAGNLDELDRELLRVMDVLSRRLNVLRLSEFM